MKTYSIDWVSHNFNNYDKWESEWNFARIAYRYGFDTNDVNVNVNVENDEDAMVAVNLLYWLVFVAVAVVEFEMNVIDVDYVDAVAVVADAGAVADLPLCLSSMGSDFEHISFSRVAKQIHYVPWHSRKTQFRFQSKH